MQSIASFSPVVMFHLLAFNVMFDLIFFLFLFFYSPSFLLLLYPPRSPHNAHTLTPRLLCARATKKKNILPDSFQTKHITKTTQNKMITILRQPNSIFYNAEGGKSNYLTVVVTTTPPPTRTTTTQRKPLRAELITEKGVPVNHKYFERQGVSEKQKDPTLVDFDSRGNAQIHYRILLVSRKVENQKFALRLTQGNSTIITSTTLVKSKRKDPFFRELSSSSSSSSSTTTSTTSATSLSPLGNQTPMTDNAHQHEYQALSTKKRRRTTGMLELQRARDSIVALTSNLEEARHNVASLTTNLDEARSEINDLRTELHERLLSSENSLHEKTQHLQMQINMLLQQRTSNSGHTLEDNTDFSSSRSSRPPPRLSRMTSLDTALENF